MLYQTCKILYPFAGIFFGTAENALRRLAFYSTEHHLDAVYSPQVTLLGDIVNYFLSSPSAYR